MDASELPPDARFKGYRKVIVQNLLLKQDNVLYKVAQYYSASQGKLYTAAIPGYTGEFGAELRSLMLSTQTRMLTAPPPSSSLPPHR